MKSLPRLVVAAVLLAASTSGRAQTIADLPEDKFKSLVDKAALYAKALGAARTVQKSYDHYATWVDIKIGPTGKERSIDGLSDIGALPEITAAAAKGPGMWPPLGSVDEMAQKLAQASNALAPLVKIASEYYAQRQFKNDGAKRGQELHGQMLPLFEQFFSAELAMRREFSAVFEDIERRYLAQIEKELGKNYEWHLRSFLLAAKTLADLLPNHADAAMIEGARYKSRFANLQVAYTLFTQYCVELRLRSRRRSSPLFWRISLPPPAFCEASSTRRSSTARFTSPKSTISPRSTTRSSSARRQGRRTENCSRIFQL